MKINIKGKKPLYGSVNIYGAKNSFLQVIAACCISDNLIELKNIPLILDSLEKIDCLKSINCEIEFIEQRYITVNAKNIQNEITHIFTMRTAWYLFGPLLGRHKKCILPYPQGDKIGVRKVNFYLDILEKMNVQYELKDKYIIAETTELKAIDYHLPIPSNGVTVFMLLMATMANGISTIYNASIEPEVRSLCIFLHKIGVDLNGIGTNKITIHGTNHKAYKIEKKIDFSIITDRIQAATYLIMALITEGKITINGHDLINLLGDFLEYLLDLGGVLNISKNKITIFSEKNMILEKDYKVDTNFFPHDCHTDILPVLIPLLCLKTENAIVEESIYENRFQYVPELVKLGAQISIIDKKLYIKKINQFHGAIVEGNDIRGTTALLLAALNASEPTKLIYFFHTERGYDNFVNNLINLGADIEIISER